MNTPHSDPSPSSTDGWDDDNQVEYELEPPDEDATHAKERIKEEALANALRRADADEDTYHAQPWQSSFTWRFSIRDLLSITAIVAISLTVFRYGGPCPASIIGSIGVFFWLLIYLERQDPTVKPAGRATGDSAAGPFSLGPRTQLRLSYSTSDLLIGMTIAAVCFSLLRLFSAALAAASLGFLVLAGIVMYWLGASPPRRAVMAWFILTTMYLVVSAIAIVSES